MTCTPRKGDSWTSRGTPFYQCQPLITNQLDPEEKFSRGRIMSFYVYITALALADCSSSIEYFQQTDPLVTRERFVDAATGRYVQEAQHMKLPI
jgi:hypothetical protein